MRWEHHRTYDMVLSAQSTQVVRKLCPEMVGTAAGEFHRCRRCLASTCTYTLRINSQCVRSLLKLVRNRPHDFRRDQSGEQRSIGGSVSLNSESKAYRQSHRYLRKSLSAFLVLFLVRFSKHQLWDGQFPPHSLIQEPPGIGHTLAFRGRSYEIHV